VGTADELDCWSLALEQMNWLADSLGAGDRCEVQVRHRAAAVPAEVAAVGSDRLSLRLLAPARAVAPGQSGVLYRGDAVLGGGIIE
jgi:tRNA-specific 2-thiouridylase